MPSQARWIGFPVALLLLGVMCPFSSAFVVGSRSAIAVPGQPRCLACVLELRGGKTLKETKKGASGGKGTRLGKAKSATKGQKKKKKIDMKGGPGLFKVIRAFFLSLVDPSFEMKLKEKQETDEINTIGGKVSMKGSS